MAGRPKKLENMTAAEIAVMAARVKRAKIIRENEEKDRLRAAITAMANANGFRVEDILR
jgi:predicted aminopeptidase